MSGSRGLEWVRCGSVIVRRTARRCGLDSGVERGVGAKKETGGLFPAHMARYGP